MAKGTIGAQFTFNFLLLDGAGLPIVPVAGCQIEVFYFDSDGAKQVLVPAGTEMATVVDDVGRYVRTITISDVLDPTIQLYGLMQGIDPASGDVLIFEQAVDLVVSPSSSGCPNMRVSFLKPAGFL